ncbi:T9SS type A sorting domain-containing protein [uncultured Psychroserpens sp.]|uniref:T9SS type A sorting domain-containing protein n=1 Tax=uncultured Psychroserpens sp. TaxID=255436 RepID=UPI002605A4F3|nr:T9SS type A sorting domain-containing protein [uncultured Psychroserpens sp.]
MKVKLLFPLFALLFSLTTFAQTINTQITPFEACDFNNDGTEPFDLELKDAEILNGLSPNDYEITYHLTLQDANNNMSQLPSPFNNVSNPQTIYVRVFENSTGNLEITNFDLVLNPTPVAVSNEAIVCDDEVNDGMTTFDLTQFDLQFIMAEADLTVQYHLTLADAENNTNPIANPESFTNTIPYFQEIYVRIYNVATDCFTAGFNTVLYLNVVEQIDITTPSTYVVCDDNDDGFGFFDLSTKTSEILGGNQNPSILVTYHETQTDADLGSNILDPIYTNTTAFNQTLFVRVASVFEDCYQTTTLDLVVDPNCLSVSPSEITFCTDDPNFVGDVDLTSQNEEIVNGQDVSGFNFSYYFTQSDAENQSNPITNPTAFQTGIDLQTIYVLVEEIGTTNSVVTTLEIAGGLNPIIAFNGPYTICGGQEIVLTPFVNDASGQYTYLWSTGDTFPEIVVFTGGTYTVTVMDPNTGCSTTISVDVIESDSPLVESPADLTSCDSNPTFDLTSTIDGILLGNDPLNFEVSFHTDFNQAFNGVNPITNASSYTPNSSPETIYVRIGSLDSFCFSMVDFNLISENCPIDVVCGQEPVNNTYCYELNDATQYTFTSSDGSQLQVVFNAGQVENNWDELYVIDSDGTTNLNPEATTYGNDGDLTGLTFTSSGDTLTIYVDSDEVFACANQNYIPIDYDVSCVDPNALPNCTSVLTSPENGEDNVNENTDLTWTPSSGVVDGYKLSVGITPGGTELLDAVDVGDVLTYDLGTLDFEVTYYVTIVPYNSNGDAIECNEESFTTRVNPNQTVNCEDGVLNTTYCYGNNDDTEFSFQSSDGQPLTIIFNAGATEVNFDEISIIDSDGSLLNPNLPYGNSGSFTGLTYTSSGSTLTVAFDTDGSISCQSGSSCCTEQFDFDVFCASTVGFIQVNAFVDFNTNSVFDTNEPNFYNGYFTYEVNNDGMINTVNSSTGSFQIISTNETDSYDITFNLYDESEACYDITTLSFDDVSVLTGETVTLDFPVVEEQSCEDLAVYLINNWTPPRPGFTHNNYLYLENLGFTTIASGTVEFTIDPLLVLNNTFSVNPAYTITNTPTGFTVDFVNLQPGDQESIGISIFCPASVDLGEIVTNTAAYITDSNDLVASNNYSTLSEIVVGSWDPNDKMEAHGPRIVFDDFAASDEWLYYTIRFQNLGTFPATFVRIEDALDDQLDETTFQMLRSSHDYVVTRTDNDLEWFFDNINLPAEQDDADGSQGFVYFRIQPKAGYAIGDIIPNTASIYFDFNAPVITNRFDSEFVEESLSVSEVDLTSFNMYPNPAKDQVTIELNTNTFGNVTVHVYDLQGKLIIDNLISEDNTMIMDVSDLHNGMYFVKLNTNNKTLVKKLIIE